MNVSTDVRQKVSGKDWFQLFRERDTPFLREKIWWKNETRKNTSIQ